MSKLKETLVFWQREISWIAGAIVGSLLTLLVTVIFIA